MDYKVVHYVNNKTILSLLTYVVTFSSFVFVMWQITNCFDKYIQKPEGTKQTIENTANLPFPGITICKYGIYKLEELKKCGVEK